MLLWVFLIHYIACGLLWPISFSLSILDPFAFLGHPRPICFPWVFSAHFLILHSHGLLLLSWASLAQLLSPSSLGFMDFPLTPYFLTSLLRACCGPFSLFYTTWCPWVYYFFLWAPLDPFAFLKAHLLILWAYDSLFPPLRLSSFSLNLLTLFYPYCWTSSCYWASSKMSINKDLHASTFSQGSLYIFRFKI